MIVFRQKLLYLGKSGCIRAKVVVFGQKWFYSGKLVVFGQKLLLSGNSGYNRAKWLYSVKSV